MPFTAQSLRRRAAFEAGGAAQKPPTKAWPLRQFAVRLIQPGWGYFLCCTRTCNRLDIQLLLVALATTVALLVGIAAEQAQLARRYQANTERRRRVLSFLALGRRAIASADISGESINAALDWLRSHIPQISWLYSRL